MCSGEMSCLLPHFKCTPPDTFFNTYNRTKCREPINMQTLCVLSATSPSISTSAAVLDIEKLQLPSLGVHASSVATSRTWSSSETTTMLEIEKIQLPTLEADSDSVCASRPWTCTGAIGLPVEENVGATWPSESLTSDEAVITAAAAEAVALAKAAAKVAKDAAAMVGHVGSAEKDIKPTFSMYQADNYLLERVQSPQETFISNNLIKQSDDVEPRNEELEHLRKQFSESISVRSRRQAERKAKRLRAAEKSVVSISSMKSASTSRKRRSSGQDIDYSDPLRYLRGTTGTSRLLSSTEELKLSEGVQDLVKLEKLRDELTERCGVSPTFRQWAAAAGIDQMDLKKRLIYGTFCKDKMIKSNIRLVISIAKNYQGSGMTLQDLVQEGCRGLIRGAEKFDASKGFKFSTYAHWWIKQAVRRSLSDRSRTIRLPYHMVEATYRVKEARKQLYNENGRLPNDEEVAEATGLSMKRLSAVLLTPKAPRSLDQKFGINQDMKPSEVIADPEAETSEDLLMKQFMRQDLGKVLDTLSPREKQVVRLRFGLEDGRTKTLQEIGECMGVSRERIRQIESSAFRKLKNKRRTKLLKQYLIP